MHTDVSGFMFMVRVSVRNRTDKVSVEPETENFLVPYYNVRIQGSGSGKISILEKEKRGGKFWKSRRGEENSVNKFTKHTSKRRQKNKYNNENQ